MKLSQSNIKLIKSYFSDKPVLKAYLFGSYAHGDATKKSDLDILVELDYDQKIGLLFIQMKLDLESLLEKPVDLISARGVSPHLKTIIDKDKQLIYAR